MPSSIERGAELIAEAMEPKSQPQPARWRWGTVEAVGDGVMQVRIGGASVPGIRCASHVMGAGVGDRVRVAYYGADAIVDAVRATSGPPQREDGTITRNTSNCSTLGDSWASKKGDVVSLSFIDAKLTNALASGGSVVIATLPSGYRPRARRYISCIEKAGLWARITASGEVRVSNWTGASYAAGSTVTFSDSYFT